LGKATQMETRIVAIFASPDFGADGVAGAICIGLPIVLVILLAVAIIAIIIRADIRPRVSPLSPLQAAKAAIAALTAAEMQEFRRWLDAAPEAPHTEYGITQGRSGITS
jgi:hypothetical protein